MSKLVQLRLMKLKYSGHSIGDDVQIEIDCLGGNVARDIKLKKGTEMIIDREITKLPYKSAISVPLRIKIIEQDLIFPDTGEFESDVHITFDGDSPQIIEREIEVRETRGRVAGKRAATFSMMFEASVLFPTSSIARYIPLPKTAGYVV